MDASLLATAHLTSGDVPHLQHLRTGHHQLTSDEPKALGGGDAGPAPYALLAAALASCTSITLRMYADRKGFTLGPVKVEVRVERQAESEVFARTIELAPALTAEQRSKLGEIAEKTPVTRTLKRGSQVVTRLL